MKRRRGRASVAKCFAPMWTEWSAAALQSADWQHKLPPSSKCSTESFELPLPVLRVGAMHSNEAGERINSYRNSGFVFFAELHAEADMHDARLNTDSRRACTCLVSHRVYSRRDTSHHAVQYYFVAIKVETPQQQQRCNLNIRKTNPWMHQHPLWHRLGGRVFRMMNLELSMKLTKMRLSLNS